MIYVTAGLIALFGLFAYLALLAIHQSTNLVFEERLTIASTLAGNLDENITHIRRELEQHAMLLSVQLDGEYGEMVAHDLRELSKHFEIEDKIRISSFIGFLDPAGTVLLTEPYLPEIVGTMYYHNELIENVLQTKSSIIMTSADLSANHEPGISLATPVMGVEGTLLGIITVDFVPLLSASGFASLLDARGAQFDLEIITDEGIIIASSRSKEPDTLSHHLRLISLLVENQEAAVLEHNSSVKGEQDHIVAYVPLATVPWGITLEQPVDRALMLTRSLQRRMIILGAAGLVAALALAWFTTRQVARPLSRLTTGSQRIAAGDLGSPIPTLGADEVRTLAQSFEEMRVRLKNAYDERLKWEKELENKVQERTHEVRQLLEKILSAQEEERKRLSRELHDETAQTLATLLVTLKAIHDTLDPEEKKGRELLAGALSQGARALTDIRRIMLDLRPSALDDLGLVSATRLYAEERLAPLGIPVQFEVIGEERRLEVSLETALFRILQEAITNIAKHAQAEKTRLSLEFQRDKFIATIEDNGRGFDIESVLASKPDHRLGLEGMNERARLIGATLSLRSRHGIGTTVRVEVPLSREEVFDEQDPSDAG